MEVPKMWKNLLPQGTRLVELCSGWALILIGILVLLRAIPIPGDLVLLDRDMSWGFVLAAFGSMQIYSIAVAPKLELLRTLISWFAGCIWIWVAVVSLDYSYSIEDVATLMLGIGNLYGFIINFNLINTVWKA